MKRDKNGRFSKEQRIEIPMPSPISFIKYILLIIIFLPWIYLMLFKFNFLNELQNWLMFLFGEKCLQKCENQNGPY